MRTKRKIPQAFWLPMAVAAVFSLSAVSVFAEGGPELTKKGNSYEESYTKGFLWESTFDKASVETYNAERELKKGNLGNDCPGANAAGISSQQVAIETAKCKKIAAELNEFGNEAESIRKTQTIFADVSRASDIAAIGAIGGVAYAQMGKKKEGQANTYTAAAEIQEVAGYASYAAGAADISMGAYAYAAQKSQLEAMNEKLQKVGAPTVVRQKLLNAAEATKAAATSHLMFGAGKIAVGYASMYLAKQNKKQAAALSSISEATSTATAITTPFVAPPTGPAGSITYSNNVPQFSVSTGTKTATATTATTGVVATTGGSMAPSFRSPSSTAGGSLGSALGGSGSFGGGGGSGGAPAAEAAKGEEEAKADEAKKENAMEIGHGGGGGNRYGGGSKSSSSDKDELPNIGSLLAGALGGGPAGAAATGINPNQVFRDAVVDDPNGQGVEAGVSANSHSLFEVVKNRYFKLMEGGRVQGPGAVQVRN